MATNPDPITGGIIDSEIVSGKWFVIPNNNDLLPGDGFASKDDAFAFLNDQIAKLNLEPEMAEEFRPR
ncbi:hypothetical protein [Rhizobium sp. MHM7A]|uniref:hypothetical protein n=1 Tax=Rhizobium sp. MHM7A TaxID=2583233 RepID=UPI00110615D8|nr:hypothetical protein [Rhizobium sp. MHM7A]TLX16115.1 hypothetical protein FFR93_01980 [Rhizobium sp. MHM7A]